MWLQLNRDPGGALHCRAPDEASVGAVGTSYDNALAEAINGLYKTELIKPRGPWHSNDDVEFATAEWGRLVQPPPLLQYCGDMPPADLEALYYDSHQALQPAELTTT